MLEHSIHSIMIQVGITVLAIFAMMSLWLIVQHYHRKSMKDCLSTRLKSGCLHCTQDCSNRIEQIEDPKHEAIS